MIQPSEGARAVALAREAIQYGHAHAPIRDPAAPFRSVPLPKVFDEPRGVFVTLLRASDGALRGCIGYIVPVYPLRVAIPRVAWAAAVDDPRFPPVGPIELESTLLELSILTVPEEIPGSRSIPDEVVIGRDGLIVDRDGESGLLLPQVAVEEGWGATRFLSETCRKAGLPPDAWRRPGTIVRRFSAELFRERVPGGPAEPHRIGPGTGGPATGGP
jgi:uncharacterized protein (TIGR00296 family)